MVKDSIPPPKPRSRYRDYNYSESIMPNFNQTLRIESLNVTAEEYIWAFQPFFDYIKTLDGRKFCYRLRFDVKGKEFWHHYKPEHKDLKSFLNDINLIDEINYLAGDMVLSKIEASNYKNDIVTLHINCGYKNKIDFAVAGSDSEIVSWLAVWNEIQARFNKIAPERMQRVKRWRHIISFILGCGGYFALLLTAGTFPLCFGGVYWPCLITATMCLLGGTGWFFGPFGRKAIKKANKAFILRLREDEKVKHTETDKTDISNFSGIIVGLERIAQKINDEDLATKLQSYVNQVLELTETTNQQDLINYTKVLYDIMRNYMLLDKTQARQAEEKLTSAIEGLNLLCNKRHEKNSTLVMQKVDADIDALNVLLQIDGIKK